MSVLDYNFSCLLNVSTDSLSSFAWSTQVPEDSFDTVGKGYACAVIVLIFLLIGIPWNGFVIVTIVWKDLYKSPTVILMLNLAVSNLLVCVMVLPFIIITGFSGEFLFGRTDAIRCKVCMIGVVNIILPFVSITTLSLMSIDRFLYLKKPLRYNRIVTSRRMLVAIIALWLVSIITSVPPLVGFGSIMFTYVVSSCVPLVTGETHIAPNFFYALFLVAVVFIPLLILLVMYVWIVCITRKNLLRRAALFAETMPNPSGNPQGKTKGANQASRNHKKRQFRMVQLFGAIFTANIITWIPMVGLAVTGAIIGTGHIPNVVYSIAYLSYLSEIVIHPILEVTLIREIRETMVYLWSSSLKKMGVCCGSKGLSWNSASTSTKERTATDSNSRNIGEYHSHNMAFANPQVKTQNHDNANEDSAQQEDTA